MAFRFYIDERALLRAKFDRNELRSEFATLGQDGHWHEHPRLTPSPYRARVVGRELASEQAEAIHGSPVDLDATAFEHVGTGDAVCVGIDVGGKAKGFHVASVSGRKLVHAARRLRTVDEVVTWLDVVQPAIVAIDSPKTCAPRGERSRSGERDLAREICGIRWTPDRQTLDGVPYYAWIVHGLELYEEIAGRLPAVTTIEVFPTASWTVWHGRREAKRRTVWSREALASLGLARTPAGRTSQDDRDAIAAAITAQLHVEGATRSLGGIVVPADRDLPPTP